jgi:UDP-glucose 4-epimerase
MPLDFVIDRPNVLVTGAGGFIGGRLVCCLRERHVPVTALVRPLRLEELTLRFKGVDGFRLVPGDLTDQLSLREACAGADTVFHLAGYAHAEDANDPEAVPRHAQVTVEGTRALLAEARWAGVKRFVFASSVKAMGESTTGNCLNEDFVAQPTSAYGRAKREAEELVLAAGRECGMHVSVLRLPLVYGPGNKGNISRMIESIASGRFLPPPEVHNRRSMVHVDDVVQALLLASEKSQANGRVYIVTDGRAYSVGELYALIRGALGREVPSWSVPVAVWRAAARCGDVLERLFDRRPPLTSAKLEKLLGSAWYCSERIRQDLGFRPTHTFAEALSEMVASNRRQPQDGESMSCDKPRT